MYCGKSVADCSFESGGVWPMARPDLYRGRTGTFLDVDVREGWLLVFGLASEVACEELWD